MSPDFASVVASPPSGRTTALVVDHAAYGSAVLLQGRAVPWDDVVSLVTYYRQVHGLLNPDATFVDAQAVYSALLSGRPELREAMGARSRTGYALRTLLADAAIADHLATLVRTLAESTRRPVVLQLPSPLVWLAQAVQAAGTGGGGLTLDHADNASMYMADWLSRFGAAPIGLVLLDARRAGTAGLGDLPAEELKAYTPIANVVGHHRWLLGMRTESSVEMAQATSGVVVPEGFWTDQDPPSGGFRLAHVPAGAEPRLVLARVARLR